MLAMLGLPINLPWFIALHAGGLCATGLSLLFKPTPPTKPASSTAMLGIATLGLGLAYTFTSYMPIAENSFLYASVPVRIILAVMAAVKAGLGAGEEERALWVVAAYDGLGGVVLGFWLGRWDGRIPL